MSSPLPFLCLFPNPDSAIPLHKNARIWQFLFIPTNSQATPATPPSCRSCKSSYPHPAHQRRLHPHFLTRTHRAIRINIRNLPKLSELCPLPPNILPSNRKRLVRSTSSLSMPRNILQASTMLSNSSLKR